MLVWFVKQKGLLCFAHAIPHTSFIHIFFMVLFFLFFTNSFHFRFAFQIIYSRIARVCKSDPGGERVHKDNWTSFVKARLNCSLPGEYPFYFDEVQGMEYSEAEGVLYATFTTPE